MLDKNCVLGWEEVEHDLYEEDGKVFGVELDLFNGHENYYCKTVEDGREHYQYLNGDIYKAIEQFNEILIIEKFCSTPVVNPISPDDLREALKRMETTDDVIGCTIKHVIENKSN